MIGAPPLLPHIFWTSPEAEQLEVVSLSLPWLKEGTATREALAGMGLPIIRDLAMGKPSYWSSGGGTRTPDLRIMRPSL